MPIGYHLGPRSPSPENTLPDCDLLAFGSQEYSTAYLLFWHAQVVELTLLLISDNLPLSD